MNHARDDVFARSAFALDQNRNVGPSQFREAVAHCLHRFGAAEHDCVGWHFPQRLNERIYTAGCHDGFLPTRGEKVFTTASGEPNRGSPGADYLKLAYLIEEYQLTKEPDGNTVVIPR